MEVFTLTPRKKPVIEYVLSYFFMLLGVVAFVLTFIGGGIPLLTVTIVCLVVWALILFRRNFEYEFAYFDGDFKVVRIKNKARRKVKILFTLDDVIQIAPVGDRSVYKYENDKIAKHYDFSSHMEGSEPYVVAIHSGEQTTVMIVDPDEKMLDAICKKGAQKVIRKKKDALPKV